MISTSKKIKGIRTKENLSQEQFAKLLSFSRAYIADIETGRTKPSRRFLESISEQYNISLDWLISKNRFLFLIESRLSLLIFIYAFEEEIIDNCERRLKHLLEYHKYILVDAQNIRSSNRLLSRILNKTGSNEKLFEILKKRMLDKPFILILKNMSSSKIHHSDLWIWSIYNIIKDAPKRIDESLNSDKNHQSLSTSTLIILDYPSYLEKNMTSFGQYVTLFRSTEIE
jgi:transcriptional regulator with XRE-family HTH domain